jgi:hypothetical protein
MRPRVKMPRTTRAIATPPQLSRCDSDCGTIPPTSTALPSFLFPLFPGITGCSKTLPAHLRGQTSGELLDDGDEGCRQYRPPIQRPYEDPGQHRQRLLVERRAIVEHHGRKLEDEGE